MRFIDITTFIPPLDWINKVNRATINFNQTNEFIPIWVDLCVPLNLILGFDVNSPRKCWYSEVLMVGADGIDVDHFRPKSNVKKLTNKFAKLDENLWNQIHNIDRAGYPYLAFEWTNFRLASQHSNQGRREGTLTKGKQDFFPLSNDRPIIATNLEEIVTEHNCLLDPCNENDPELLKFGPSGQVDASYPVGTWEYCRAKVSIEIFHLNFDLKGLISVRLTHWNMIERQIGVLNTLYEFRDLLIEEESIIPNELLLGIERQENYLLITIDKSKEFSAVAIDCIKHNKNSFPWLNTLFDNVRLKK